MVVFECILTRWDRGTHSSDDLSSLISDHYKQEDIDFHLGNDR